MAYSMHFDLMAYIMHFVSSCIQKDATVQTQSTQFARPPLVGTSFCLGHVLRLCPSWLHNLHCTFLLPSFNGVVLSRFSLSSISFLILAKTRRPFSRINRGQGQPFEFLQDPAMIIYLSTQGKREHSCIIVHSCYSMGQCTALHRVDT